MEVIGRPAWQAEPGEEAEEALNETQRAALAKAGITEKEKEKKAAKSAAGKKKSAVETVEKQSPRDLFDYVLSQGRKTSTSSATKGWAR